MKKSLKLLGAALLALFTSSCLEHNSTIRLNKDGSGTITEETVFSAEASAMMAAQGGAGPNFADAKKADAAAAKMGAGVTVEKVEKIDKDGRTGGRVVFKFKDINTVKYTFGNTMTDSAKDMGPPGAPGDAPDAPGDKPESKPMTFKYEGGVLTMVNPDAGAGAGEKKAAEPGEPDPQALAMMQAMFKDMKMSLKVEIADGIADTNRISPALHTAIDSVYCQAVSHQATRPKPTPTNNTPVPRTRGARIVAVTCVTVG
jgi:hypothetical protein